MNNFEIKDNTIIKVNDLVESNIIISKGIKKTKDKAFMNQKIKSIVFNEGFEVIAPFTFYGCSELEKVILPETITHIGMHSFDGCSKLKEIIIPKNCGFVGWYAFNNCDNLTIHYLGENIPKNWSSKWNNQNKKVILNK